MDRSGPGNGLVALSSQERRLSDVSPVIEHSNGPTALAFANLGAFSTVDNLAEVASGRSELVTAFMNRAFQGLTATIAGLPAKEKDLFRRASSLEDLLQSEAVGVSNPALTILRLGIIQLSCLIRYAEANAETIVSTEEKIVTSHGVSSLAATALASSSCLKTISEVSDQMVPTYLQLGLELWRSLDGIDCTTESWNLLLQNVSASETSLLLEAHNGKVPSYRTIYLSANTAAGIQIAGPPSSLRLFVESHLRQSHVKHEFLPSSIPWRSPYLSGVDTALILGPSAALDRTLSLTTTLAVPGASNSPSQSVQQVLAKMIEQAAVPKGSNHRDQIYQSDSRLKDMSYGRPSPLQNLSLGPEHDKQVLSAGEQSNHNGILDENDFAIVGMAMRCPGVESLDQYWDLIVNAKETHRRVPADRFDIDTHYDPSGREPNTSISPWGCFIDNLGQFDTRLFNISPREAAQIDPAQRLILLTAYEALDAAGYSRDRTPSTHHTRIGTFFGATGDDYREANTAQNIDFAYVTGGVRAFGPGRVNFHFKLDGPSYSVDTACSASAASLQLAIASLKAGDCDTAIVGGANVLTASDMYAGLSRGNFLSATGSCKTFLEAADGYCRGEAVGCVVIKRLSDALADNDNVRAVIKACLTNHSSSASSIVQPHAGTQETLFRKVLAASRSRPEEVDYVEMHGTGTQLGDAIESESVGKVFLGSDRQAHRPLFVGSVKPNIGHGEAASGICSLIKAVLMLEKSTIPPFVNAHGRLNPNLPSGFANAIPGSAIPLSRQRTKLLINNFGATGSNTSVLIERGPTQVAKSADPRPVHLIAISAKTRAALCGNISRLSTFLQDHELTNIADVAYTTTARRQHHPLRVSVSCSDRQGALIALRKSHSLAETATVKKPAPTVFVFQGQGGFQSGIGGQLYQLSSAFRASIQRSNDVAQSLGFPSIVEVIVGEEDVEDPVVLHLALVALELALYDMWLFWGVRPTAVVGHSIGEYPALCAAGILSLADTLFLVGSRANMLKEKATANSHGMLSIRTSPITCETLLQDPCMPNCQISCFNGASTVVSGPKDEIGLLHSKAIERGDHAAEVAVLYAFHSTQMEPILEDLARLSCTVQFRPANVPIGSTVTGKVISGGDTVCASYISNQTRQPVRFGQAVQELHNKLNTGPSIAWIGIGPSTACMSMVASILPSHTSSLFPSLARGKPAWNTVVDSLAGLYQAGADIDWRQFHLENEHCLSLIDLPAYAFDMKNHWISYQGDWMRRKTGPTNPTDTESAYKTAPRTSGLTKNLPGSLQRVVCESVRGDAVSVTLSADPYLEHMHPLLSGHSVNSNSLCSSSVYADMAYTIVNYACQLTHSQTTSPYAIEDMHISRPYILDPSGTTAPMIVTAEKDAGSRDYRVSFASGHGEPVTLHASCRAIAGSVDEWQNGWARTSRLIKLRKGSIQKESPEYGANVLSRKLAYKLFTSLVDYAPKYQGMDKVTMTSEPGEAIARVIFRTDVGEGARFQHCPYWIDSILHLSGFVLNAGDVGLENTVYIAHGWKSLKIATPLRHAENYTCYVQMLPEPNAGRDAMSGDLYCFDSSDQTIAVCQGLTFQALKRAVLDQVLPKRNPSTTPIRSAQKYLTSTTPVNPSVKRSTSRTQSWSSTTTATEQDVFSTHSPVSPSKSFDKVLDIIAMETGVLRDEMTGPTSFTDLGVDSLLSLSILEKLGRSGFFGLPQQLFLKFDTVDRLREFFEASLAAPTPPSSFSLEQSVELPGARPLPSSTKHSNSAASDLVHSIMADELGLARDELTADTSLVHVGLDSLMGLSIRESLKRQAGLDLEPTFFVRHETLAEVQAALAPAQAPVKPDSAVVHIKEPHKRKAEAVLLRSSARLGNDTRKLFLLPDGSGSAASYMALAADLAEDTFEVYGLNSAFRTSSQAFTCSVEQAAALFVQEITAVQAQGPYHLGGWSVGGAYAFECARHLITRGEQVQHLLLLDAPCFSSIPPMTASSIDTLASLGTFGAGGPSKALLDHFGATVRALASYKPMPLAGCSLPTTCIWARAGVLEGAAAAQPGTASTPDAGVEWLLNARHDTGAERLGWATLLPCGGAAGADTRHVDVDGDHFSMMRPPHVHAVAGAMDQVLAGARH